MTAVVSFDAFGVPRPQGSKKAINAGGFARLVESNDLDFARWRNAVTEAAHRQAGMHGMLDGPLRLTIVFTFRMPASAKVAEKKAGWRYKHTAPDTDKLIRSVGDALQAAGLVRNDSLFVDVHATKLEVLDGPTGAHIVVESLAAVTGVIVPGTSV